MRVLVLGGTGMLGHKLVQGLASRFEVWTTVRGPLEHLTRYGIFDQVATICGVELTSGESLGACIDKCRPDVVINAVGVIKQAEEFADRAGVIRVNSVLPNELARLSIQHGFRLILISTDCVFSGDRGNYSEDDAPDANDVYGLSKRLGEVLQPRCLTLRTSLIGRELATRHSLLEWLISNRGGSVKGYRRAIYSGFPTVYFAELIAKLIESHPDVDGIYHAASQPISKFHLLELLNEAFSLRIQITADESVAYDRSLDSSRFEVRTGILSPSWQELVEMISRDPTPYDRFSYRSEGSSV